MSVADGKRSHATAMRYRIERLDGTGAADWDACVAAAPSGHYQQTSAWARFRASSGWSARRLLASRDSVIAGGVQVLIRPLPVGGSIAYVPKGPVLATDDPAVLPQLMQGVRGVCREQHVRYLAIQPPDHRVALARLPGWAFRANPKEGTVTVTLRLDLTRDRDALLRAMRRSTRQNIRRGQSRGLTGRAGTERDFPTFLRLLSEAGRRRGFDSQTARFAALWRLLRPHGLAQVFLVEHGDEPVSAMLAIPFGHTLFSHVSAWSGAHAERKPNELLDWSAITWAGEHGYRSYDFEGIDARVARAVLRGEAAPDVRDPFATRYKLGFGGQVTVLPQVHEHVFNPVLRWGLRSALPRLERRPGGLGKAVRRRIQGPPPSA